MMAPSQTLVLLTSLAVLAVSSPLHRNPVKRDSPSPHLVEVPTSPHLESSSHHLDLSSSQSHQLHHQPSQSHHLDQKSSQLNHLDHQLSQNHQLHQPNTQSGPVNSIHDHNEVHPQSKLEKQIRKNPKKGRKSNEDLLHHIGMAKLRNPSVNHHRKRLASQSRKTHSQKSTSDSKMFVIKLPPNPYYYAHHLKGFDFADPQPNSVNKVPVNFNTNGKPSRVYHWNIPVLKKMVARKAGSAGKSAILADSDIFNIDKQATWNDTDDDKSVYRKTVFYGPKKQSKHTFRKYYSGNGKPHSFYVMEKNKTPSSIYRLLP